MLLKTTVLSLFFCLTVTAQLRIASLNIAKKSGASLIEQIRTQPDLRKADILLLQEVVDSPWAHVAEQAAQALEMHCAFARAFHLHDDVDEGLAILSRYPLASQTVIPLTRNVLHFKNRIRIALAVTAETPEGRVRVIDIHLDNRINEEQKHEQLAGIWPTVDSTKEPIIVGGDFNTGDFYWVSHVVPIPGKQHQRATVNDDMRQHGLDTLLGSGPATYHLPGQKLDWIFVRGLTPVDSGVTPIRFSDHNSVWMTVSRR